MKRPLDSYRDLFREGNEENKELFKFVFEKSDSFSLWIIGLAVGAVTLIANDVGKIKDAIDHTYLKLILACLTITVICGIMYRVVFLYLYSQAIGIFHGIAESLTKSDMVATESRLKGNETYLGLINALKRDFDEDYSSLTEVYNNANDQEKQN